MEHNNLKKQKAMVISHGEFDGISIRLVELCIINDKRLYKSFGSVQSWVGGIGIRAGLINRRSCRDFAGSNPVPSAFTALIIKWK